MFPDVSGLLVCVNATDDLVRLGHYVTSRRVQLGYKNRVDFATALGITDRTLSDIEQGKRKSNAGTYALVENVLQWRPGSISDVMGGGEPALIDNDDDDSLQNISTDELLELQEQVQEEVRRRYRRLRRRHHINKDAPTI